MPNSSRQSGPRSGHLTRPRTVTKNYRRAISRSGSSGIAQRTITHVLIGKEDYFVSADGLLMPGKRNQAAGPARLQGIAELTAGPAGNAAFAGGARVIS
jgi:hypothetical protein